MNQLDLAGTAVIVTGSSSGIGEDWADLRAGVPQIAPLGRIATPDDIADACIGVIGSTYATGQVFVVDGGLGLVV